jgi:hypothetical protein
LWRNAGCASHIRLGFGLSSRNRRICLPFGLHNRLLGLDLLLAEDLLLGLDVLLRRLLPLDGVLIVL